MLDVSTDSSYILLSLAQETSSDSVVGRTINYWFFVRGVESSHCCQQVKHAEKSFEGRGWQRMLNYLGQVLQL